MTQKEPKEKREAKILEAAIEVFVENGYEGATMEAIAKRAGLTKGGLYHHFSSKEVILLSANVLFTQPVGVMMEKALTSHSASDALMGFCTDYLIYWFNHRRELAFVFLSMTKALADNLLAGNYQNYAREMLQFYESLYRKGIESGEFIRFDPYPRAIALLGAMDGLLSYMLLDEFLEMNKVLANLQNLFIVEVLSEKANNTGEQR